MTRPLLLAMLLPTAAWAGPIETFEANRSRGLDYDDTRLVVRAAPGVGTTAVQDLAAAVGCAWDHRWGQRDWHTLACPAGDPRPRLARLAQSPALARAVVPFSASLAATPDDLVSRQWHHDNTGQRIGGRNGTPGADIGMVAAWDLEVGDDPPIVAVVDTGVWTGHDELQGRIHTPDGEDCDNGLDDDGNGYIDDCWGWDPADNDNDPDPRALPDTQPSGAPCIPVHGTFISGLIAATGNNTAGGTGVVQSGRIMPIKMATDDTCLLTDTAIAEGMYYAIDNGAQVINASWSFRGVSPALSSAFGAAERSDVLVVIAAGNERTDLDEDDRLPIAYHIATDVVVAATENRDRRAGFSNWGSEDVDLGAPGATLWSTGMNAPDHHRTDSGTSYAAPLVAGVAALVWDAWPMLRTREIRTALLDGAEPVPNLDCENTDRCVRTGARLDAPGALAEAERIATAPVLQLKRLDFVDIEGGDGDRIPERGETIRLAVTVENTGHAPTSGIQVTASVNHPHATIPEASVEIGVIDAYDTRRPTAAPTLAIDLACDIDEEAQVRIVFEDKVTGEIWAGDRTVMVPCDIDEDEDGTRYPEDCDDTRGDVFPGAPEVCDGVDNDCDGLIDADDPDVADAVEAFVDADGDGWGTDEAVLTCAVGDGTADRPGDCDDADPEGFPGSATYREDCSRRFRLFGGCTSVPAPLRGGLLTLTGLLLLARRRRGIV